MVLGELVTVGVFVSPPIELFGEGVRAAITVGEIVLDPEGTGPATGDDGPLGATAMGAVTGEDGVDGFGGIVIFSRLLFESLLLFFDFLKEPFPFPPFDDPFPFEIPFPVEEPFPVDAPFPVDESPPLLDPFPFP